MPIVELNSGMDRAVATSTQLAEKDKWLGELAQRVSAGGVKLVADGFRSSTDPYGDAWAPLKRERRRDRKARIRAEKAGRKPRGARILVRSGRMRASAGASPQGRTAKVVIPTWYARFHQEGTVKMRQRMLLPSDERGMPEKWGAMVEREVRLFAAQKFGVRT